MISDSVPWKIELLKIADRLERRKTQRRWTEQTGFLVERDVMVSAYALRKLLEARKVSDSLAVQKIAVTQHSLAIGAKVPDALNRYEVWENYDLDNGRTIELPLREFCNQIVHSWNWMLSATEDRAFNGFFVSSDRMRARSIYFVPIDTFVEILRAVGSEDVIGMSFLSDENGQMQIYKIYNEDERAALENEHRRDGDTLA